MGRRILSLLLILGTMGVMVYADPLGIPEDISPTLVLGFMLLAAYCIGYILEQFGMPRITGYIFAGLLLGPHFLQFYSAKAVTDLNFLNNLALAFIAFCAGGELKLENLRKKVKSIAFLISGGTLIVFAGVTLIVYFISEWIPFMKQYEAVARLAISSIFGVISVARSPSSTIAIICETRAEGDYTDTVLGVTIATDVVIIMLFAFVISACELVVAAGSSISFIFFLNLVFQIILAFILGFLMGKLMIFLIRTIKVEFPIVITAMGFFVIKFSHILGNVLQEHLEIHVNLEPLLICMAAGFTVQNFSKHGHTFLHRMEKVSYPIYIAFFAITGASIDISVLKSAWFFGLVIVVARLIMLFFGSYVSGRLAGDTPRIYRHSWLAFITQAGVSLGLLAEVVRRFPEIGIHVQTVLIAAITFNQVIGPILFKYAIFRVGEGGRAHETGC